MSLEYYKGIEVTTTISDFRSYNQNPLSVSKNEIGGTYNPIFVFVYLSFVDVGILFWS